MQEALITLNRRITAFAGSLQQQNEAEDLDGLTTSVANICDEAVRKFNSAPSKTAHVRLYQRTLQRLAACLRESRATRQLLSVTATTLQQLQEQFPERFNYYDTAVCTASTISKLAIALQQLSSSAKQQLVSKICAGLANELKSCPSWHALKSAQHVIKMSHELQLPGNTEPLLLGLPAIPCLKQPLISNYQHQIETSHDAAMEIRVVTKRLSQLTTLSPAWPCPTHNTLKFHLLEWLNIETEFLQSPASPQPSVLTNIPSIRTSLSVTQLAAFLRLLFECRILHTSNQTQLLNIIATHVTTANATAMSPQSLRNKYYSSALTTISSLKDICITLLNHARKLTP